MKLESGTKVIDEFLDGFVMNSYGNYLPGRCIWEVLMGRVMINQRFVKGSREIDCRTSTMWIGQTTTGKSSPIDYIGDICDVIGIVSEYPDDINDAALLGTTEEVEYDKETADKVGKKKGWEHVPGILNSSDIFWFDEGNVLFNSTTSFAKNVTTWFQKALNPLGSRSNRIRKKMAHGDWITVEPGCSLIITTYPPDNFEETMTKKGWMQRQLIPIMPMTDQLRLDNLVMDIDMIGEPLKKEFIDNTINTLQGVKEDFEEPKDWDFSGAKTALKQVARGYHKIVIGSNPSVKNVMHSFVSRYSEQVVKQAMHYSALRSSTKVNTNDVRKAGTLIGEVLGMIHAYVEDDTRISNDSKWKDNKELKDVMTVFSKAKRNTLQMSELTSALKIIWGVVPSTISRRLKRLEESGKIKRDGREVHLTARI